MPVSIRRHGKAKGHNQHHNKKGRNGENGLSQNGLSQVVVVVVVGCGCGGWLWLLWQWLQWLRCRQDVTTKCLSMTPTPHELHLIMGAVSLSTATAGPTHFSALRTMRHLLLHTTDMQ